MNKQVIYAAAASFVFISVGSGCSKGSSEPTGQFATVNGEPISMNDFYVYLQRKPTVQVIDPQRGPVEAQVAGTLALQSLKDLIQQQVLLQLAKEENVYPTADDIAKELKFRQTRTPDFIKQLQDQGLTLDEIRDQLRLELARERVVTKGVTVTEAQAKSYISAHKAQFSTPAQAQLLWIAVPSDAKKKAADAELTSGQSFSAVAMKYSIAPNARQSGGKFPQTNVPSMPSALQKIVATTPELKSTPWQKSGVNWIKFYVQSKMPAKPVAVDASLLELVQRQLAEQKGQQTIDLNKKILDKIKVAKVQVNVPYLQTQWNQVEQGLANAK